MVQAWRRTGKGGAWHIGQEVRARKKKVAILRWGAGETAGRGGRAGWRQPLGQGFACRAQCFRASSFTCDSRMPGLDAWQKGSGVRGRKERRRGERRRAD